MEQLAENWNNVRFGSCRQRRDDLQIPCSIWTVRRRLLELGIRRRQPARKIFLSAAHKEARVRFAEQELHRNWANENVIFCDEKVFKSYSNYRQPLYRRDNSRYDEENLLFVRHSGRITMGMWGWMSVDGPGELVRIPPRMTGADYVDILENVMLPSVRILYPPPEPIVFVQDNSSVHTSRIVQEWFRGHPEIELINWPSKSPDLNPIENLWAAMVKDWNANHNEEPRIRRPDELHAHCQEVWERFRGRPTCENLVTSMPNRLRSVIEVNGGYIKY